jgi:hypothetical protein
LPPEERNGGGENWSRANERKDEEEDGSQSCCRRPQHWCRRCGAGCHDTVQEQLRLHGDDAALNVPDDDAEPEPSPGGGTRDVGGLEGEEAKPEIDDVDA